MNNFIMLTFLVNLVYIIACFFLGYKSLKRYLREPVNYENVFYWGFSFLMTGIGFAIYEVGLFVELSVAYSVMAHMLFTVARWLQLFAVCLSVLCVHTCFNTDLGGICKICVRKRLRVVMWSLLMAIMAIFMFMSISGGYETYNPMMSVDLRLMGNFGLDISVEVIRLVLCMAIIWILMKAKTHTYLKYGFILVAVSRVVQIANIFWYNYNIYSSQVSYGLYQFEWALSMVGIMVISYYVYKISNE